MRNKGLRAAIVAVVLAAASVATADDAATRQRIDELERKQRGFDEELQRLRESLDKPAAPPARVEEVERRQGIMTEELRRLREALVLPEDKALKSAYGLGPAASKVYGIQRGLSIGGYGETNFKSVVSDKDGEHDEFDFLRFVLYVGYKYNDWIVLNSEIEFEHATTESSVSAGSGSVSVEFATLDFLLHPMANARFGLLLVPVGFVNEIHEPPFYFGNVRPQVEQQVIPSTWRANGFGLFGELLPGLEYRTYGVTSLDAKGFTNANLRDGRQNGDSERADTWSWVGRLDYTPIPELELGGSAYLGDQGQNEDYGSAADGFEHAGVFLQLYEVHGQVRTHGLEMRALGTYVDIDDAGLLSRDEYISTQTKGEPIANVMLGAYGEIAYDIMPLVWRGTTQYLAPWFRYSWFDTQNSVPKGFSRDRAQRRDIVEVGLAYKPIPQVVFKLDYRDQDREQGTLPDEVRVGFGFVF